MNRRAARLVVAHADEALVIGDDRRHDRQAEPGAVGLGREVRLEDARPRLRRHADAVVGDLERAPRRARRSWRVAHLDARPLVRAASRSRAARRDGVVEHVDDRALHALAIELEHAAGRRSASNAKSISRCASRKSTSASSTSAFRSLRRVLGRRHAREGGELVHQVLQLLDLLDDRARALVEHRRRPRCSWCAVAPAQALRRELDRRERVLDLVRDPARDLAPRLHALDAQQMRDVLEEEHARPAACPASSTQPRPGERAPPPRAVARALERAAGVSRRALAASSDAAPAPGAARRAPAPAKTSASGRPTAGRAPSAEHVGRGAVHGGDPPVAVGRDDAGGDVGEHDLQVAPARVELGTAASSGRPSCG